MADCSVAIVTGGAQGLGAAISVALLKEGYKVCLTDIQCEKGRTFVQEQEQTFGKGSIVFFCCDVSKEADFKGAFEYALKEFKRIDVLVNNAGILAEDDVRKTFNVNLIGTLNGCQTAVEFMGKGNGGRGGFVVNVASLAGLIPFYNTPIYASSKHAVVGLTRSYGDPYHLEKDGVMFAALCPSYIATDILLNLKDDTHGLSKRDDLQKPEDVAQGVIKLLHDKINGATLVVSKQNGFQYIGLPEELHHLVKVARLG